MADTFNFGIDLGTTNSLIACYKGTEVEVFKNPMGMKEVLPSVVAFRKERILVGDKANELLEKDPANVVSVFKRKMGTSEVYYIESLNNTVTPVDLSSYVLKELKNFVYTGEQVSHVVITIPASFDTVQSGATKEAGFKAGFKEVVLLQEPIAASLAFVNKAALGKEASGYWIVYDLGGGTFDVALIRLQEGEMTIIDHVGDNFLGGTDFDLLILDKIIIPALKEKGDFIGIEQELKSSKGKYNKLFYELLYKAEQVKIQLSSSKIAEVEIEIEDNNGESIDFFMEISDDQFNAVIEKYVVKTIELLQTLLEKNNLDKSKIESVLMIGGSTYIPLVRKMLVEQTSIKADYSVDPTTAVAVGAAYYSGTKTITREVVIDESSYKQSAETAEVKAAFQRQTQEPEEFFAAKISGLKHSDYFFRITRVDGGFDTGLQPLQPQVESDLKLLPNTKNDFIFQINDSSGNKIKSNFSTFSIIQGKFGILGQPLPADICLEVDDVEEKETRLEVIFEKNALLPLKKRITKEIGKAIKKGSADSIVINILEGKQHTSPASNKPIGVIRISGENIERDILKGTDVEITIEMSESRELKVFTYLSMTGQEFVNVFKEAQRVVDIDKLKMEIAELLEKIEVELNIASYTEDYAKAAKLQKLQEVMTEAKEKIVELSPYDVTDSKFQIEDIKRTSSYKLDELMGNKKLEEELNELKDWRHTIEEAVERIGTEQEKKQWEEMLAKEKEVLASGNNSKVKLLKKKYSNFHYKVKWKDPAFVKHIFYIYAWIPQEKYKDPKQAEQLIKRGEKAVENEKIDELRAVISSLDAICMDLERRSGFENSTGLI